MDATMATDTVRTRKPQKPRIDTAIIDASFKALISQGYSYRKAAQTLGLHESTGGAIAKRIREQGQDPQALVSESRNVKLGQVYDRFLEMGTKIKKVRASDVVAIAKDYRSTAYPTRAEGLPPTYQFVQINLNEASPRDPVREPVDITPGGPSTTRGSVSDLGKSIMDEFLNESTGCSVP